jgi:hypothetical protein
LQRDLKSCLSAPHFAPVVRTFGAFFQGRAGDSSARFFSDANKIAAISRAASRTRAPWTIGSVVTAVSGVDLSQSILARVFIEMEA